MKYWLLFAFILLFLPQIDAGEHCAYVADIDGTIGQGTVNQFEKAIRIAENDGELLIIRLNTNGGVTNAMEDIIRVIESAEIPIVIYVSPAGSVAFSAGTFILMASKIAAMSNGTVIGSCQPRIISPLTGIHEKASDKEINAYAALMQSLANEHGRNVTAAHEFVTENLALNDQEALAAGVIEFVANNISNLLNVLDNQIVTINGASIFLNTTDLKTVRIKWNARDVFINYITDPQIASLLLTIGIFGLIFGFLTPGFHVPEVLGGILTILSIYGLSLIGVNVAGVLLTALAFIFFFIETLTPTFGFWTGAAIITFIFGIMLIPADDIMQFMPTVWYVSFRIASIIVAVVITLFFAFALVKVIKARQAKPRIGKDDLVGEHGIALTDIAFRGQVKILGKIWSAESECIIKKNEDIVVIGQSRLTLKVKKP